MISSVVVAVLSWVAAPHLTAAWARATVPAEERLRMERSVYYSGCSEARAAGAAPIHRGSPGYREGMDGDGDGVACEQYRGW